MRGVGFLRGGTGGVMREREREREGEREKGRGRERGRRGEREEQTKYLTILPSRNVSVHISHSINYLYP